MAGKPYKMKVKPYKMKVSSKAETPSIVAEVPRDEKRKMHWEDKASGEYCRINTGEKSGSGEYRRYTNINLGNKNTGYSTKFYAEEKYPEDSAKHNNTEEKYLENNHEYYAEEYPEDSFRRYAEEKYYGYHKYYSAKRYDGDGDSDSDD